MVSNSYYLQTQPFLTVHAVSAAQPNVDGQLVEQVTVVLLSLLLFTANTAVVIGCQKLKVVLHSSALNISC